VGVLWKGDLEYVRDESTRPRSPPLANREVGGPTPNKRKNRVRVSCR